MSSTTLAQQSGAPVESGAFVSTRGSDTLFVENWSRAADGTLRSSLELRGGTSVTYVAATTSDARVTRITLDASGPGVAPQASHAIITFRNDTAIAQIGTIEQRAPTVRDAIPWVNPSFALADQIVRRATALGKWPAQIPVFTTVGARTFTATVSRVAGDTVAIAFPDVTMHIAANAAGHATGGSVSSQGIVTRLVRGTVHLSR